MFHVRVRVTRRQEFPRGSIVIAGALSRLKTSLQEQREGALLQLSPCPLSAAPCSTLLLLSLSLSLSPLLFPSRNAFAPCSSTFISPYPCGGASLFLPLPIGEFDFSATGVCDTSMPEEDVLFGICLISVETAYAPAYYDACSFFFRQSPETISRTRHALSIKLFIFPYSRS